MQVCDDSGPGSLRDAIAAAASGELIDLTHLSCGTITLASGEIVVNQSSLTLQGPASASVAISGNHASRVLNHTGFGTLVLNNVTVEGGMYNDPSGNAHGGCIYSAGSVSLSFSTVTDCTLLGSGGDAKGGGIYVYDTLSLIASTISHNSATSTTAHAWGGGAYVYGSLVMKYSTVDSNKASSLAAQYTNGGGLKVRNEVTIEASTISRNESSQSPAIHGDASLIQITNSTISSNVGTRGVSAIWTSGPLKISGSTISLNRSGYPGSPAVAAGGATIELQSSIIANNTDPAGPNDLRGFNNVAVVGANNLIISSDLALPADTISADPELGPLQRNGGRTETHALLPGSAAIANGNNIALEDFDQRGVGYPRATGTNSSVDMGSFQFDSIFADSFR